MRADPTCGNRSYRRIRSSAYLMVRKLNLSRTFSTHIYNILLVYGYPPRTTSRDRWELYNFQHIFNSAFTARAHDCPPRRVYLPLPTLRRIIKNGRVIKFVYRVDNNFCAFVCGLRYRTYTIMINLRRRSVSRPVRRVCGPCKTILSYDSAATDGFICP